MSQVGCGNWKPKHGIGPYCGNCGYHEREHRDTYPYTRQHPIEPLSSNEVLLAELTWAVRRDEMQPDKYTKAEVEECRAAVLARMTPDNASAIRGLPGAVSVPHSAAAQTSVPMPADETAAPQCCAKFPKCEHVWGKDAQEIQP